MLGKEKMIKIMSSSDGMLIGMLNESEYCPIEFGLMDCECQNESNCIECWKIAFAKEINE